LDERLRRLLAPVAQLGRATGLCPVLAPDKREVTGSIPVRGTNQKRKEKVMSLVWAIIILALIYGAIGVGAEFINTTGEDEDFKFDKASLIRILKWPTRIF
jgi:hypothetical protein